MVQTGYMTKIFGEYKGVIMGFAGNRGTFELFKFHIMDFVKTNELKNDISLEKFFLQISDITTRLGNKHREIYDILLAVSGKERGGSSILYRIFDNGEIITINEYQSIGTGEPYASFFLKKLWNKDRNMEQTAALGYFIIKYIQHFELNRTVGLDNKPPLDKPTIWLIPDNSVDFRVIDQQYLETIELKTTKRLDKFEKKSH